MKLVVYIVQYSWGCHSPIGGNQDEGWCSLRDNFWDVKNITNVFSYLREIKKNLHIMGWHAIAMDGRKLVYACFSLLLYDVKKIIAIIFRPLIHMWHDHQWLRATSHTSQKPRP